MKKVILLGVFVILISFFCISFLYKGDNSIPTKEISSVGMEQQICPDDWIRDSTNYIIDSTLQRHYVDDTPFIRRIVNYEIVNAEQLYHIVKPILNKTWGEDIISIQKPFRINQIDKVWIITGSLPRLKSGKDVVGGVFYMEIKNDGTLLKSIHSE